jgi:hypothetical protein
MGQQRQRRRASCSQPARVRVDHKLGRALHNPWSSPEEASARVPFPRAGVVAPERRGPIDPGPRRAPLTTPGERVELFLRSSFRDRFVMSFLNNKKRVGGRLIPADLRSVSPLGCVRVGAFQRICCQGHGTVGLNHHRTDRTQRSRRESQLALSRAGGPLIPCKPTRKLSATTTGKG